MRQNRLMINVKEFLKSYITKDSYYFSDPDRLHLALITLLKDSYTESKINSLHSKYVRDIKQKVSFTNASKSFFAYLDKDEDSTYSSEVSSRKKTEKKKIRKDTHAVKNRRTNKTK
jgi:hypothetical protein